MQAFTIPQGSKFEILVITILVTFFHINSKESIILHQNWNVEHSLSLGDWTAASKDTSIKEAFAWVSCKSNLALWHLLSVRWGCVCVSMCKYWCRVTSTWVNICWHCSYVDYAIRDKFATDRWDSQHWFESHSIYILLLHTASIGSLAIIRWWTMNDILKYQCMLYCSNSKVINTWNYPFLFGIIFLFLTQWQ